MKSPIPTNGFTYTIPDPNTVATNNNTTQPNAQTNNNNNNTIAPTPEEPIVISEEEPPEEEDDDEGDENDTIPNNEGDPELENDNDHEHHEPEGNDVENEEDKESGEELDEEVPAVPSLIDSYSLQQIFPERFNEPITTEDNSSIPSNNNPTINEVKSAAKTFQFRYPEFLTSEDRTQIPVEPCQPSPDIDRLIIDMMMHELELLASAQPAQSSPPQTSSPASSTDNPTIPTHTTTPSTSPRIVTTTTTTHNNNINSKRKRIIFDCLDPSVVVETLEDSLRFESNFECGNCRRVLQVASNEYDIITNTDVNSHGHTQVIPTPPFAGRCLITLSISISCSGSSSQYPT